MFVDLEVAEIQVLHILILEARNHESEGRRVSDYLSFPLQEALTLKLQSALEAGQYLRPDTIH